LYEELYASKNLDTKPETEEVNGNKLKLKVTIGEKVIYMEKKYEFSDGEQAAKDKIKKLKEEKEKMEALKALPQKIKEKLETDFPGRGVGIKEVRSDEKNVEYKQLTYKKAEIAILLKIDITDPRTPVFAYITPGERKEIDKETVIVELDKQDIINYLQEELKKIDKELSINAGNIEKSKASDGKPYYFFEILLDDNFIGWMDHWAKKDNHNIRVLTGKKGERTPVEGKTLEEKIKFLIDKFKKTEETEEEEEDEDSDSTTKFLNDLNRFKDGKQTKNYRFEKLEDKKWRVYRGGTIAGDLIEEENVYVMHFGLGPPLRIVK